MPSSAPFSVVRSFLESQLQASGIILDDIALKAFIPLDTEETCAALGTRRSPLPSIYIPYHTPTGERLLQRGKPVFRVRLDTGDPTAKKKKDTSKLLGVVPKKAAKQRKYDQPDGIIPEPYFSPNVPDWPEILADPTQPLIIVEGEKKAYRLCQEGEYAIGIGGVWNWEAKKRGIFWIPGLGAERINWVGRRVDICFDADHAINRNVCSAMIELSQALSRMDADVCYIRLPVPAPSAAGEKVGMGVDDFLVRRSLGEFKQLRSEAVPIGYYQSIIDLRERYAMVKKLGKVVDLETFDLYDKTTFVNMTESDKIHHEHTWARGELTSKEVSAAEKFLRHPFTTRLYDAVYFPGEERIFDDPDRPGHGLLCLNTWPGLAVEPIKGDCQPAIDLVNHVLSGHTPAERLRFMQSIAYPLKYPGTKLKTMIVIHGKPGIGKTLIHETLSMIYGVPNSQIIGQDDLESTFSSAPNKQFVTCDEIDGTDRNNLYNKLKTLGTQQRRSINIKNRQVYEARDFTNYFFTSNHAHAIGMKKDDRRFFVIGSTADKKPQEFYKAYGEWLKSPGGLSAWLYYLQNEVDMTGFNPDAEAMMTSSKEDMVAETMTTVEGKVQAAYEAPDFWLKVGDAVNKSELLTGDDLSMYLMDDAGRPIPARRIWTAIRSLGIPIIRDSEGNPRRPRLASGRQFVAIWREQEKWAGGNRTDKEVSDYLEVARKQYFYKK